MESEKAEETGKKKRWTGERPGLSVGIPKDPVGLADLAEETGNSRG